MLLLRRFIKELHAVRDDQHQRWHQLAADTLSEAKRLQTAKELMSRLGMAAIMAGSEGEGEEAQA